MPVLSDYQEEGVRWIIDHPRAIEADVMGLGKTAQAITAMVRAGVRECLVICPKSLIDQWRWEISQWDPKGLVAWHVVNYEKVRTTDTTYQAVIVDEATKIKNPEALRTVRVLYHVFRAERVLFMTGTPIRNHDKDLWTMAVGIFPSLLLYGRNSLELNIRKSYTAWLRLTFHIYYDEWGKVIVGDYLPGRREAVTQALHRVMLRRTRELLHLPPLSQEIVHVPFAPGQMQVVRQLDKGRLRLRYQDGEISDKQVTNDFTLLLRMRQAALAPELIRIDASDGLAIAPGGSGKTEWLKDWWSTHRDEGLKAIVFTQFAEYLPVLQRAIPEALVYHGQLSVKQRKEVIEAFHAEGPQLLAMTAPAGSFGLNLQVATVVIWTDMPWTPDEWEQGTARAYRRGQEFPVHEIILAHQDTIDTKMLKVLNRKHRIADKTLSQKAVLAMIKGKDGKYAESVSP